MSAAAAALSRRRWLVAILVASGPLAVIVTEGHAETPNVARPTFRSVRYDEDWSGLCVRERRTEWTDALKCLPLGQDRERYLSIGGETRQRYERYRHPGFGSEPDDPDGYYLQRTLLHGDLHLGGHVRLFTQLQSSVEEGRRGGPRATDENELDLHQAFVDLTVGARRALTLRAGRQEIEFGSSRLVSTRDGLNTRLAMDAVRLLGGVGPWRASAHVLKPVRDSTGIFDDERDRRRTLWGAYVACVRSQPATGARGGVVYYLAVHQTAARFDQGVGDERRHTFGVRLWGGGAWDYNWEVAAQVGRFGTGRIRAWDVATDSGVTLRAIRARPRLGLRIDLTSGDRRRDDQTLGTFNALFPGTAYSGLMGLVGPANAIDLAPSLTLQPTRRWVLMAGSALFWRYSRDDGVYGVAVNLLRAGRLSRSRHVGNQATLQATWMPTSHAALSATASWFVAGRFLKETPLARNVGYVTSWVTYRF